MILKMMPYKKFILLCFSFLFWIWAMPALADPPAQAKCEPAVTSPVDEDTEVTLTLNGIEKRAYRFYIYNQNTLQLFKPSEAKNLNIPTFPSLSLGKFPSGDYSVQVYTECNLNPFNCTETLECDYAYFSVIPAAGSTGTTQPNQSCTPPLPRIPISVTPDSGGQATQYKLTLHWAELSPAQFALYKDKDVTFYILDNTNPVDTNSKFITFTGDQFDPGLNRIKENKEYTIYGLSNSGVSDYTAYIRLQVGTSLRCTGYEVTPATIHITTTTCASGLSKGVKCDPSDQVTKGDPCLKCLDTDPCQLWHIDNKNHCGAESIPPPGSGGNPGSTGTGTGGGSPCQVNGSDGINTAIGCVPTKPADFIQAVSRLLTGLGGGIALLMMIAGAFRMITSAGNPDAIKAGSEQFSSAIIGLLFIIFAVLLLKVIGYDILNIPGFTFQ